MNEQSILSSLMVSNDFNGSLIKVSGNLRLNKHDQLGFPVYQLKCNPEFSEGRQFLLEYLKSANIILPATIVINKGLLDDEEVLQAFKDRITQSNYVEQLRIADEGYTLTLEDYNKLSFVNTIVVDNCVEELNNNSHVFKQYGVFKYDIQALAQPVLERRTKFDDLEVRPTFHINHKLSESEFSVLAQYLNSLDNPAIELNYFDPSYYDEFLNELQKNNVKSNTNIRIIGYLLEDKIETYNNLTKYQYDIDVVYSTCHDVIDMHIKEPYTENRLYYSQIEGGGLTSLQNYLNVLNVVDKFENTVKSNNLSPLEAAILAKMQIDNEYIYDPDADYVDEWDNINLSQIINHEVAGKKRAVCMGFSTLFSALLRRVGVPMFRYTTNGHSRNIGRIYDKKYDVDTICTCDLTGDLQSNNNWHPTYAFFMIAPREYLKYRRPEGDYESMTIADTFALSHDEYNALLQYTNLGYEEFYSPIGYNPMGYTATMLQLMDVIPKDNILIDVYSTIYQLCEQKHLESIPKEKVLKAINNVLDCLKYSPTDKHNYAFESQVSFIYRNGLFSQTPAIASTHMDELYKVNPLTSINASYYRKQLTDDNKPIFFNEIAYNRNMKHNNFEQDTGSMHL